MKKRIMIPVTILFAISLSTITGVYAIGQGEKAETVFKKQVDVTGDEIEDTVEIKGIPYEEGTLFLKEVFLTVKTSIAKSLKIELDGGYEPNIKFKDLNHDNVKDLFVSIATGGSGGLSNYYLYSLKDSTQVDLTVPDPLAISSQFLNDYQATIKIDSTGESYTFDLADRKADYDRLGLYQEGKLNEPVELMVFPYSTLKPVKIKGKQFGLKGVQRISGAFSADSIAFVESTWLYKSGKWNLEGTSVRKMIGQKENK